MNEVRGIIKSLKGKGKLIFMSSHLLGEVADVCDEVAMINHGKLLDYDAISNVITKFTGGKNAVEVGLRYPVSDDGVLQEIAALPGVEAAERIADKCIRIQFSGGEDVQEQILAEIVGVNIGVLSYKLAWSELEDVYLSLFKDAM
jgi:ABC-2 type transport system ATP-binding protein